MVPCFLIDRGLLFQQEGDDLLMAVLRRHVERSDTIVDGLVHEGSLFEQEIHNSTVSVLCRDKQRRRAIRHGLVHRRAFI